MHREKLKRDLTARKIAMVITKTPADAQTLQNAHHRGLRHWPAIDEGLGR